MTKLLTTRVDTVQTLWARYAVQMAIVTVLIAPRARDVLRTQYPGIQLLRSIFLLGATTAYFFGYQVMSLTQTTAIAQISPIWVAVGAAVFLGERFGVVRLIAIAAAFCGALLIIRPATATFTAWALLPLVGSVFYAGYALATRFVGATEDVWTSLFYAALLATVVLTCAVPFFWQPLEPSDLPFLIGVGLFGAAGQLCLIRALSLAEASLLAPFSYAALVFAVALQVVVFGIWPDGLTVLGALVIAGSGLYVWQRSVAAARLAEKDPDRHGPVQAG